jgi:hypothetical protein
MANAKFNNHHFKRARWRRLWRQQIQDYLIAAIQNVRILLAHQKSKAQRGSSLDYAGKINRKLPWSHASLRRNPWREACHAIATPQTLRRSNTSSCSLAMRSQPTI